MLLPLQLLINKTILILVFLGLILFSMHLIKFLFSKVFVINLIIALSLIAGGLLFTMNYLDDYTLHDFSLEVPNCQGMPIALADSLVSENDFTAVISDSIYLEDKKGGIVIEQDPAPGKKVKQGRKIYMTITSMAPPQIAMPNLVDMSLRQAISLMETYGLVIGELTYEPDPCTNCVLAQKREEEDIEEGTKINKGATIDLVLGQGLSKELTPIPYLLGINYEMATNVLKTHYLNTGNPNYDQTVETKEDSINARVYKQIPTYSEEPSLQMGSTVDLYLTMDTNNIVHTVNPEENK